MIKTKIIRRINLVILMVLITMTLFVVPLQNSYSLDLLKKQELTYSNADDIKEVVYLIDQNNLVARTEMVVNNTNGSIENKIKSVLMSLIENSAYESHIQLGFKPMIPDGTKIINVTVNQDTAKINFSKEILDISAENEDLMMQAIIYTVTSINPIKNIIIYVDGSILKELPHSKIPLPPLLNRGYGINRIFDLTSTKNVKQVNIYYSASISKYDYYVPVTKYLNSEAEKLEIIIEELKSNYSINPIFLGDMPSTTNLNGYEINNTGITLVFDENILSNKQNKLPQSLKESISLSIKDAYNTNQLVIKINDQELTKTVFNEN